MNSLNIDFEITKFSPLDMQNILLNNSNNQNGNLSNTFLKSFQILHLNIKFFKKTLTLMSSAFLTHGVLISIMIAISISYLIRAAFPKQ